MKKRIIGIIITFLLAAGLAFGQDQAIKVTAEGNVGIGTDTPTTQLEVAGDLTVTGDVVVEGEVTASDKTIVVNGDLTVTGDGVVEGNITVNGVENASVPRGAIIMWSGSELPAGWALCNGQNETPDLRDRFIIGAGSSYTLGDTGGSETVNLTTAQLPSHSHSVNDPGHNHIANVVDPGHTHMVSVKKGSGRDARIGGGDKDQGFNNTKPYVNSNTTGIRVTINSRTTGISIENTGAGEPHENRPPYYALIFIMKL